MSFDNSDDVIDSRDIIERITELESELADFLEETEEDEDGVEVVVNDEDDFDDIAELRTLRELRDEVDGYASDWKYGVTLIRRTYWVEYVEEMLKDIGDLPRDIPSYIEIDWEATASNIEQDYSTVDFDGEEYLYRCS
jgi:hypothetical protein